MGSPLGEVPWLVSRRPWKWQLCCLAVLSHRTQLRSLAQGALKAGHRPEQHRKPRSKSMMLTSVFPSFLFWNLNLVHRTLGHPLHFSKQLHKYTVVPFALSLSEPCYPVSTAPDKGHELWLCRKLPNSTRGWDRWGFFETNSYCVQQGN